MSYDISLYDSQFLKRALEINLGDWRQAPELADSVVSPVVSSALSLGFVESLLDSKMAEFMKQQGHKPGREFTLNTKKFLAKLTVFPGSITSSVSNSDRAMQSIETCRQFGQRWANEHKLGFYDP